MEKPTILTAERVYKQRYPDATKKELVIVLAIYKELVAEYEAAQRAKVERQVAVVKGVKETGKKVKVKEFLRQSLAKAREAKAKRAKEEAVVEAVKATGKKEKVKAFLRETLAKARAKKEAKEAAEKAEAEAVPKKTYESTFTRILVDGAFYFIEDLTDYVYATDRRGNIKLKKRVGKHKSRGMKIKFKDGTEKSYVR
jgi:cobalamin biosynthesis Mg chelatase CobN